MTLRADIQFVFDRHDFVIWSSDSKFKIHLIKYNPDYAELLHWRDVTLPIRVPIEFLYARFAYTIINSIREESKLLFKPVEISETIQARKARRLQNKINKKKNPQEISDVDDHDIPVDTSLLLDSSESFEKMIDSEESFANLEKRWKDYYTDTHPEFGTLLPLPLKSFSLTSLSSRGKCGSPAELE